MARCALLPARNAVYAIACALDLTLAACGGTDATGPGAGSPTQNTSPGPTQPPSGPAQQPSGPQQPSDPAQQPTVVTADSLAGTYVLVRVNDSQPGQLVTLSNPDGHVFGLYRFDASSQLWLDVPEQFELEILYSDDKGEYTLVDGGRYQAATPPASQLGLTFTSAIYGDKFTGAADDSSLGIAYDLDGDGRLDTFFYFRRVDG